MTKDKLKDYLISLGFSYERDKEYNRDLYINKNFASNNRKTKLEIFVDYYTMRFQWWYEPNKKVGRSVYINNIIENFSAEYIADVILELRSLHNIK